MASDQVEADQTSVLRSSKGELPGFIQRRLEKEHSMRPGSWGCLEAEEGKTGVKWFPDPADHSEISCGSEPPASGARISFSGKQEKRHFA